MINILFKRAFAVALSAIMVVPFQSIAEAAMVKNGSEIQMNYVETTKNDSKWELVWSDEFSGNELDSSKWSCQIGNGYNGWGNYESQYYTADNVSVSNGTLKITAKEEKKAGFDYTSARIRTITDDGDVLFSTKYGKIEARIKLPAGTGLWPAFWMMPVDDEYGYWPLSGEIDIMEARGRELDTVYGTIHFGEQIPFNKNMGDSYTFENGTDITDFHVYSVEWNENSIIWYVDNVEYYRTSNWYTMTDGVVAEYPAPFNKEFYLILNMAVGGNFDNFNLPTSEVLPGTMEVDYVRVYHNTDGYDSSNIVMPEGTRDDDAFNNTPVFENGNLLSDINFDKINKKIAYAEDVDYSTHNWYFVNSRYFAGNATLSKVNINGKKYISIDIVDPGTETYAIAVKQNLPLAEGYVYKVTFDAMSNDSERNIVVTPVGGAEVNYMIYNNSFVAELTNKMQTFEFTFMMKEKTNLNAALEFDVAKQMGNVTIGNVTVTAVDTYVEAEKVDKQETTVKPEVPTEAETTVKPEVPTEVETTVKPEIPTEAETTVKPEVPTEAETTVKPEVPTEVETTIKPEIPTEAETTVKPEAPTETETTVKPEGPTEVETTVKSEVPTEEETTEPETTVKPEISTDEEKPVIKQAVQNGNFSQGLAVWYGYGTYYGIEKMWGSAYGKIYAKAGKNPWDSMLVQGGIYLTEGKTYTLEFRAKKSAFFSQKFSVVVDDETYNQSFYQEFYVGNKWQTYSFTFVPNTDKQLTLKYFLGMVNKDCILYLDDVKITIK